MAFETEHRITLPADYRAFLLIAGDGGAGPYYGINRLDDWRGWFDEPAEEPGFLARESPLVYASLIRKDWISTLPRRWQEWGAGSLAICDQGCTYEARLIVTGPSRGRVVYMESQGGTSSHPYFVRDLGFLDWYERWLDNVLAGGPDFWFGRDNPEANQALEP